MNYNQKQAQEIIFNQYAEIEKLLDSIKEKSGNIVENENAHWSNAGDLQYIRSQLEKLDRFLK